MTNTKGHVCRVPANLLVTDGSAGGFFSLAGLVPAIPLRRSFILPSEITGTSPLMTYEKGLRRWSNDALDLVECVVLAVDRQLRCILREIDGIHDRLHLG
jgi:hypothetical protein